MGWFDVLTGGVVSSAITWLKEAWDNKARKTSYHAKRLLEQADGICGIARMLATVVRDESGGSKNRSPARVLWMESTSSLLNVWLANAWVLDQREDTKPLRHRFSQAVELLRQHAIAWQNADASWRRALGMMETDAVINPAPCDEAAVRRKAAEACLAGIDTFLGEFQALHNALQPLVREYTSPPDGPPSKSDG